jgi:hypothetical protein
LGRWEEKSCPFEAVPAPGLAALSIFRAASRTGPEPPGTEEVPG